MIKFEHQDPLSYIETHMPSSNIETKLQFLNKHSTPQGGKKSITFMPYSPINHIRITPKESQSANK